MSTSDGNPIFMLKCCRYKSGVLVKEAEYQLVYRTLQLWNTVGIELCNRWIFISFVETVVVQITMTFALVAHHSTMNTTLSIAFLSVVITSAITSFKIINHCVIVRNLSEECYTSRLDTLRRRDVCAYFYNSCRPIEYNVGGVFPLASRDLCLQLFGGVILKTTIDLLLTFR